MGEEGGGCPGQYLGMCRPEVRKKRVGEAKGSNVDSGEVKRVVFRALRVGDVHVAAPTVFISPSSPDSDSDSDDESDEVVENSEVVKTEKSNTPSLTISPLILTGLVLEVRDSVKAREVANVPPKKEP